LITNIFGLIIRIGISLFLFKGQMMGISDIFHIYNYFKIKLS